MKATALSYARAGLSVIPIKADGTKRPTREWKEFQSRIATDDEIQQMFRDGFGIAIIGGHVSRNLEILDFETGAPFDEWHKLIETHDADLVVRLVIIQTPSGGFHVVYRCAEGVEGNQKLALRPDRTVLIETRGEGGYVVTVGSPAACHPAGKPYTLLQGHLVRGTGEYCIPEITAVQRALMLDAARSFTQASKQEKAVAAGPASAPSGDRPGDLYNARESWQDVLGPHGWKVAGQRGDETLWCRPGKTFGFSATTNYHGSDLLYVFSTNALPFEPETSYSKFAAFALLEHSGDFAAAARAIAEKYGLDREQEAPGQSENKGQRKAHEGRPGEPLREPDAASEPPMDREEDHSAQWPELDRAALYGLAGDTVKAILPHTEADPAALLIQILCAFGNVSGRNAYYQVEADRHYMNLYTTLVGPTSKGRKGTSKEQVMALFRSVDEGWEKDRIQSGLSSGEGLIWAVRDPIEKREAIKDKNRIIGYQATVTDEGVDDKRLLVTESEFASTLRVLGRDGNTLSAVMRNGWDSGRLRVLTKNSPAKATDAHVSIVGHITQDELRRFLDSTEAANGFANRFLWICVRRSKCLPEGGRIADVDFHEIVQRLVRALDGARRTERVQFDPDARAIWHGVYRDLSEGQSGLLGAVTSRAEAQVVRLALIYALLDCSAQIQSPHLEAALAVWEYAENSARYIFGDALGFPVADEILNALRRNAAGLTRTEISYLFNRHRTAEQIGQALKVLVREGKVRSESRDTGGRAAEVWVAIAAGSPA